MPQVLVKNGSFKTTTDWTLEGGIHFDNTYGLDDSFSIRRDGFVATSFAISDEKVPVAPGQVINMECWIQQGADGRNDVTGAVAIVWYDNTDTEISRDVGSVIVEGSGGRWYKSTGAFTAPVGAVTAAAAARLVRNSGGEKLNCDIVTWDYINNRTITLLTPAEGSTYTVGDNIPFRVTIGGTEPTITSVSYFADATLLGATTVAPYDFNYDQLTAGTYEVTAVAALSNGSSITSAANTVTVNAVPVPPITREYKASNAYTYLVTENFSGLANAIPSTALVTGIEIILDYQMRALIRSFDTGVPPEQATVNVAFDITNDAVVEAILMSRSGDNYTPTGTNITAPVPLVRTDFDFVEEGLSEGKRWTVLDSDPLQVTIGSDVELFGNNPIAVQDFITRAIGLKFYPNLLAKPAYAGDGDCCFRFFINKMRLRVYFDAGSAEYYFASPDKTQVIKGTLVSATVDDGNLRTGDASGVLQLQPALEVMDGTQTWIGEDWTIHSAYPPTDANQIGDVAELVNGQPNVGMEYNGLPTQTDIVENRSRYEFITANFYADESLDSIYGVHGLPRAFAFNAQFFYKIHTQPDPQKDSPRHVAYHHGHLALAFANGETTISVIGEPYNYDGAQGASSWSIGDRVNGLLPLSGTILGVFGSKSIWGISGTTVDNFATQVIAPRIGAIEYTVTDMGFPVYANAYGIYTLDQTERYGDYLGTPMSQDVSPWLRPRLIRDIKSDKEVVVAWPVRSKNQYRLAFSDGYVLSMTMNYGQAAAPTFSKQKYFITEPDEDPVIEGLALEDYPSIYPIAVSSQLDNRGEERIHIANISKQAEYSTPVPTDEIVVWGRAPEGGQGGIAFDHTQTFNSEFAPHAEFPTGITILGYYSPTITELYPPDDDPLPVDLDSYTFVPLDPVLILNTDPGDPDVFIQNNYYGDHASTEGFPDDGQMYIVSISPGTSGEPAILGMASRDEGF